MATIAVGLLAWYYLRDDPAAHPGVNEAERAHIAAKAEGAAPAEVAPQRIAPRSMIGLLVGRMSWAMINFGLLTWGPSYLAQARGFDLKQMGYGTFVIFMAGMAGSLFAGFLADWLFARGWTRAVVYRGMLGLSGFAIFVTFVALPQVAHPVGAVALLSVTLFFVYWGSLYIEPPAAARTARQGGPPRGHHELRRQLERDRGADHHGPHPAGHRRLSGRADVLRRLRAALRSERC